MPTTPSPSKWRDTERNRRSSSRAGTGSQMLTPQSNRESPSVKMVPYPSERKRRPSAEEDGAGVGFRPSKPSKAESGREMEKRRRRRDSARPNDTSDGRPKSEVIELPSTPEHSSTQNDDVMKRGTRSEPRKSRLSWFRISIGGKNDAKHAKETVQGNATIEEGKEMEERGAPQRNQRSNSSTGSGDALAAESGSEGYRSSVGSASDRRRGDSSDDNRRPRGGRTPLGRTARYSNATPVSIRSSNESAKTPLRTSTSPTSSKVPPLYDTPKKGGGKRGVSFQVTPGKRGLFRTPDSVRSWDSYDDLDDEEAQRRYRAIERRNKRSYSVVRSIYSARLHTPVFSYLIAVIDLIVFGISMYLNDGFRSWEENSMLGPSVEVLESMGAKFATRITNDGEWWRFVTPIFLHGGVFHLVSNLLGTVQMGANLERDWGFIRTATIYFISGIGGNLASAIFLPNVITVGASGALFGLLGAALTDSIVNWREMDRPWCSLFQLLFIIAINIGIGMLPMIDNFCHVGGLMIGVLTGLVAVPQETNGHAFRLCCQIVGVFGTMSSMMAGFGLYYGLVEAEENWCEFCDLLNP